MSKSGKLWLGTLTLLPLVFIIIYFVWFFSFFVNIVEMQEGGDQPDPSDFFSNLLPLFAMIGLAVLLSIGLLIYYIVHVTRNPRFQKPGDSNKLVWILVLIFAGFIGQVVYFIIEVWPDRNGTGTVLDSPVQQ
jgi:hypothetical protein